MRKNKEYWVSKFDMQPHPEGGFYKETYRSEMAMSAEGENDDFPTGRAVSTAIYFLLCDDNFSAFHRIASDELWHFYYGHPIYVHVIHPDGKYEKICLGDDAEENSVFQAVVPAGAWFASEMKNRTDYALVGCTVAPGFDFRDFELAEREQLTSIFPQHKVLIENLTRSE